MIAEIDVTNEDKLYWEKVLSENNLSVKDEPQTWEITPEEFKELTNLEFLPEENYEQQDDPVINYNGITKDRSHSGLSETNEELRTKIDSDDTFFTGHAIIKPRLGNAGDRTGIPRSCPNWAKDNAEIRKILLRSFPQLATNPKHRAGAGRWAIVIQLYYRMQMTHGQIAAELRLSMPTISSLIRAIDRVTKGRRADGSGLLGGKKGRARKVML